MRHTGGVVPGTGPARALLVGVLAGAALLPLWQPDPVDVLVAASDGAGRCEWAQPPAGDLCSCAGLTGAVRLQAGLPLPLNRAVSADLQALRGIGPGRADAIERDRATRGPFASVAALARVPGIGPRTAERLAQWLAVDEDPCGAPVALPGHGGEQWGGGAKAAEPRAE